MSYSKSGNSLASYLNWKYRFKYATGFTSWPILVVYAAIIVVFYVLFDLFSTDLNKPDQLRILHNLFKQHPIASTWISGALGIGSWEIFRWWIDRRYLLRWLLNIRSTISFVLFTSFSWLLLNVWDLLSTTHPHPWNSPINGTQYAVALAGETICIIAICSVFFGFELFTGRTIYARMFSNYRADEVRKRFTRLVNQVPDCGDSSNLANIANEAREIYRYIEIFKFKRKITQKTSYTD